MMNVWKKLTKKEMGMFSHEREEISNNSKRGKASDEKKVVQMGKNTWFLSKETKRDWETAKNGKTVFYIGEKRTIFGRRRS